MRTAYTSIAHLISLFIVVQAATVAWGIFTMFNAVGDGNTLPDEFPLGAMLHGTFGMYVLPVLALALVVVSLLARSGVKWALLVLAAVVVQVLIAFVSFGVPVLGILHGMLPFGILALAEIGARSVSRSAVPSEDRVAKHAMA
jgi:hypothetical protein